jgi:hypothetical protein
MQNAEKRRQKDRIQETEGLKVEPFFEDEHDDEGRGRRTANGER